MVEDQRVIGHKTVANINSVEPQNRTFSNMKSHFAFFLSAILISSCGLIPDEEAPLEGIPPLSPSDTATNCYNDKRDTHGEIVGDWLWVGLNDGRCSEVRCFRIDSTDIGNPNPTSARWAIHSDDSLDIGAPGSWSYSKYQVDSLHTNLISYDFTGEPMVNVDTLRVEILRLDEKYMITYRPDTDISGVFMRRK